MAITIPTTFTDGTTALAAEVNANFAEVATKATDKTGDTVTGTLTLSGGGTIAGATGIATVVRLITTNTGATSLVSGGGITAGTGSVAVVDTTGKIPAISSTYFTSLAATLSGLTMTGAIGMADNILGRAEVKDYSETLQTPGAGATKTINFEDGNTALINLEANTTIAFSNPPATGKTGSVFIEVRQDGTGSRTLTWPASVVWPGGTTPTQTATADKSDLYFVVTRDAGTTYRAGVVGQNYA